MENNERLQLALNRLNYETNGYGTSFSYAMAVYDKYGVPQSSPLRFPMKEEDVKVLQEAIDELKVIQRAYRVACRELSKSNTTRFVLHGGEGKDYEDYFLAHEDIPSEMYKEESEK